MSHALHTIVGTICVEPLLRAGITQPDTDDSTLGRLLESLAFQQALGGDPPVTGDSIRLLVATRVSRIQAAAEGHVRANLAQLLSDLTADYERLTFTAATHGV